MFENWDGLLGLKTPKSAVSKEWVYEMGWFFHANTNLGKLRVFRKIYNYGHNIERIFDVLSNFPFTTSETKTDYL